MQRLIILLYLIVSTAHILIAANSSLSGSMDEADSLFMKKKYTEAFNIYESIYLKNSKESPNMLLKMAYIKEGLNDYTNAIYYLSQYHQLTHDEKSVEKVLELSDSHDLQGYNNSDQNFLLSILIEFKASILLFFAICSSLVLSIVFFRIRKGLKPSLTQLISITILLIISFSVFITPNFLKKGILIENTFAYKLPSSGDEIIMKINKGSKVEIMDKQDVWTAIEINDNIAYIKTNYIRPLN